ncbi:MAG: TetR family transcriptional regulator [Sphingomonadales bacterium]|nr:TetR family transcriptional regulator [Sphingomonadales bacterium]MDE2171876.1 TetR family transcriptional regulator [Sphingomonadales bacterium]
MGVRHNLSRFNSGVGLHVEDTGQSLGKRQIVAQKTREDILDMAYHEFSEKGFAGARIDEIAEKTKSSKRMIYYYFGSKDGLYQAVLERAYHHIRAQEQDAHFEDLSPELALRAIIGHNFDYHFEHPEFVRLVMSENVLKGEHIARIPSMKSRNRSVIEALGKILEKGAAQGVFREGLDPIDLHMTISALSFYNVSNRYTFMHNFGVDFSASASRARRRVQIIDCVMAWVRKA